MAEITRSAEPLAVPVADAIDAIAKSVINRYYTAFNQRSFVDASACFADDATLDQLPFLRQEAGGIGYLQFVSAWTRAFPDAVFIVRRVTSSDSGVFDIALDATGTHRGPLQIGGWAFQPTDAHVTFALREVIELRSGKIAFSSVIYDLHEIVEKLTQVDLTNLLSHLDRLRQLADDLRAAPPLSVREREVTVDIGRELDAARHAVRPYFKRNPVRQLVPSTHEKL